jgi:hypothetical protein
MRDETEQDQIETGPEAQGTLAPVSFDADPLAQTPEAQDLIEQISRFDGKAHRFLMRRLESPDLPRTQVLESLGLTQKWYERQIYGGTYGGAREGFRELERLILDRAPVLRQALARAVLLAAVPRAAMNVADTIADEQPATDRARLLRHQASVRLLESEGVLSTKAPTINVDARSVTSIGAEAWAAGGASAWRDRHRQQKAAED